MYPKLTGRGGVLNSIVGGVEVLAGLLGIAGVQSEGLETLLAVVGPGAGDGLAGLVAVLLGLSLAKTGLDEEALAVGEELCETNIRFETYECMAITCFRLTSNGGLLHGADLLLDGLAAGLGDVLGDAEGGKGGLAVIGAVEGGHGGLAGLLADGAGVRDAGVLQVGLALGQEL